MISQQKYNSITYDIRKIEIGQGHDYTNRFLLDYPDCKENYKTIAIGFSKPRTLDADSKAVQKNNFAVNLDQEVTMFFITEEVHYCIIN